MNTTFMNTMFRLDTLRASLFGAEGLPHAGLEWEEKTLDTSLRSWHKHLATRRPKVSPTATGLTVPSFLGNAMREVSAK